MFKTRLPDLNTRTNGKLDVPLYRRTTGQRSLSYRAVIFWDSQSLIHMSIVPYRTLRYLPTQFTPSKV